MRIKYYIHVISFGEAYIYKLPGLVMFENGCCPSLDKALQC